jgi:hypothetical protein
MKEAVQQPFQERRGRGGRGSVGKQGQGRRQGALFREKGRQGGKPGSRWRRGRLEDAV